MAFTGHVAEQPADVRHGGRTLAARSWRRFGTAFAGVLLAAALAAGEAAGQPGGLFREAASATATLVPDFPTASDSPTLGRRLVFIDFEQLTPDTPTAGAAGAMGTRTGVLRLNLFDDAVFTGLVERVAPTFSGGYSCRASSRGWRWAR